MKRTLFTLCLAITAGTASAQLGYDLSCKTGQPYTPLSTGTLISSKTPWEEEHRAVSMPFSLKMGDKTTGKFNIAFNSMMPATDTTGVVNGFMPLFALLADRGTGTDSSHSPIRYTVSGTAPSRIFKVEYWNAGFADIVSGSLLGTDSVNFQVWAYETSDIIEFHYGDAKITDTDMIFFMGKGPMVAYFRHMDVADGEPEIAYMLKGDPAAPSIDSTTDMDKTVNLNSMPAKGTVYRFTPNDRPTSVGEKELLAKFNVYPTRTGNTLYISNNTAMKGQMEVSSITGQQVISTTELSAGRNELNVSQLPAALYFLQVVTPEGRAVYRFIKE
jgi:hypothetical protein